MTWYTAAEIAELQLPDAPRTKRGIQKLAQREGWEGRRRQARGGGWEYHVSNLPERAQAELTLREAPTAPANDQAQERQPAKAATKAVQTGVSEGLKQPPKRWQTDIRDARAALVQEAKRLGERIGIIAAEGYLASQACDGQMPATLQQLAETANARAGSSRVLSKTSLRHWRYLYDREGIDALLPKPCPHERTTAPDWLWPLMYYYARPSKPSIRWCREQLARDGYKVPTVRTCQREIQKLGALQKSRGRLGPRELKRLRAYKVRDFQHLQPGDVYAGDGHRDNKEVLHPRHGKPFRPEITTIVDVATRRIVGWSAGLDESAWLVADALRHAGETAVPAIFYTDRGSGFINDHLSTSAYSVLARMGTLRETSLPYNSQARGVIERLHRSVYDRESRALPGYVGADMDKEARQRIYKATRKDIRERGSTNKLLGWEDYLQWLADTVAAYNARPHTSLPKIDDPETGARRHMSPDECWERAVAAGADIFRLGESELDDIFRPYETRTVQRAQVQLHGKTYFSTELERQDLHGQEVLVGYDIHDPSRVWIRNAEGRFVCTAELDANKTDFFPQARIEEAREKRAKGRLERLEARANEVREELDPKVIPAPVAQSDRVTQEEKADLEREIYAERPASGGDNRRLEFARALHMERRLDAGEQLAEAELRWLRSYQTTADYETFQQMIEDFGTSFLPSVEENPAEAGTSTGRN